MNTSRPDPDALLARVQAQEERERAQRGRIKIFFGANAGVGKTYSMLEAAHKRKAEGVDVVVGYVEPHGRAETEALLKDLERLPFRIVDYRGARLREFDLSAALERKPQVILVDELAHSNPPDFLHAKRWQDIDELLDAGIDVYTTVNVQHLETLNDIVEQITGVRVQETVPDTFFDRADEVELIDLPPDDLLQRLREGRVYLPERVGRALDNFFRKGNLIALRELALRKTADRVDAAMREYRNERAISEPWLTNERILVCVGHSADDENLVRGGKRLAAAFHAEWIVVHVETPGTLRLSEEARNRRIAVLRLAESLGAQTVTLGGASVADEVLRYARLRNVTRLIVGVPKRHVWGRKFRPSTVDSLIDKARDLDLTIIKLTDAARYARNPVLARTSAYLDVDQLRRSDRQRWPDYAWSLASTVLCTAIGWGMTPSFELANIVMVYLLGTVVTAVRLGRGPAIAASVVNVAAFDFFFVPPRFTMAVSDAQYLITFAIMLVVTLMISDLTARVRLQAKVAGHRERRTALLYAMSREMAGTRGLDQMAKIAVKHTSEVFDSQVVLLMPDSSGQLVYPSGEPQANSLRGADLGVAQWVFDNGKQAGLGTDTLPGHDAIYLPLGSQGAPLGVLAVLPANARRVLLPEQAHFLETFTGQISLSLERASLADRAQEAAVRAQDEETRSALLASISHDLRTPLAIIVGASSALLEGQDRMVLEARQDLARTVYDEAQQMTKLVNNVLELTRLEGGALSLRPDWFPLDELVGASLDRLRDPLKHHRVAITLPRDMPLIWGDGVLLEQVLYNLLENASKYTPPGTLIEISATYSEQEVTVTVADNGPGLKPGEETQVFDKFHRGEREGSVAGAGLGLAICKAIVEVHRGTIQAQTRGGLGALFRFTLPRNGDTKVRTTV